MPATTNSVEVYLHEGYRGFVNGTVKADKHQHVFVKVLHKGVEIASATFEGKGEHATLKNVLNHQEAWSFGPLDFSATLKVTITNGLDKTIVPSKVLGPFQTHKVPEDKLYPMEFYSATIVSEDATDGDYNDCTVTVVQYK